MAKYCPIKKNMENNFYKINLEKNKTTALCSCGLSKNQPFCDGSHRMNKTDKLPILLKIDDGNVFVRAKDHILKVDNDKKKRDSSNKNNNCTIIGFLMATILLISTPKFLK